MIEGLEKRQIKLGLLAFGVVFLTVLFALKPYLPRAVYHNFATIYDYRFFENRVVRHREGAYSWEEAPKKLTPPPEALQNLLDSLDTTALLVLEDGKVAYEKYSGDGGEAVLSGSFSMAKSIVGILTGIARDEGKIRSLDEPLQVYIPEWEGRDEGKVRIRNLLQMTAGLNWDESYWNPLSITTEAYYGWNLMATALRQRSILPGGARFSYQSGTTQLLGLVVSRAVNQNLADFASSRLWMPIGAEADALWSLDHEEGQEKAYCCFNARARDFARIGELVRNHGIWNGRAVVSEGFVEEMTTPHDGVLDSKGSPVDYYGYQWWVLRTPSGNIPYARGILGQYILVLPSKNRVIVRLGKKTAERVDHHPTEVRALAEWGLSN